MRFWGWCFLLAMFGCPLTAGAAIVYTYDFPGSPGSGLAANQSSSQPYGATFSDFTRVGGIAQLPTANVFDSNQWPTGSFFDPNKYATFTLTADPGYHVDLSQLTFDEMRAASGPTKGQVSIFVNGSTTSYADFNYNPDPSVKNKVFNFADITNATTVEFRFYGWNGGSAAAGLLFDNVALTVLSVVPESNGAVAAVFLFSIVIGQAWVKRRKPVRGLVSNESGQD